MAIPDEILRKPGKLTPEEQDVMREHCARGYQMLRKIPFLSEAAEIVFTHQEHYDGSGYPSGLSGPQIPIGARIFAVADTLDAITSDRPYRVAAPLKPHARRSFAAQARSLIPPLSTYTSRFRTNCGWNCGLRSPARTGISRLSTYRSRWRHPSPELSPGSSKTTQLNMEHAAGSRFAQA